MQVPQRGFSSVGDVPLLGALVGVAFIANLIGLFAWTSIALTAFAFVGLVILTASVRPFAPVDVGAAVYEWGQALLVCAMAAALVAAPLVAWQFISPKVAASVSVGLFSVAVLVLLVGHAYHITGGLLNIAIAAALIVIALRLPGPSTPDRHREAKITSIVTDVQDPEHNNVEGAQVCLAWGTPDGKSLSTGLGECLTTGRSGKTHHTVMLHHAPPDVATISVAARGFQERDFTVTEVPEGRETEVLAMLQPRAN